MSIEVQSNRYNLGQLASNHGFTETIDFVESQQGMDALKELLMTGESNKLGEVMLQAGRVALRCSNPDIKSVLVNLQSKLKLAKGSVLIRSS